MRVVGFVLRLLRAVVVAGIVVGLIALVALTLETWDDWVFLGVLLTGLVAVILALDYSDYPPPWRKRGFRRDSPGGWGTRPDAGEGSEMVRTIAVGTDGSETASRAVDVALEMAERYRARLVAGSSYRPVAETRLRDEQKDAPPDIQWSINPAEEVEAILRSVEERAHERGLETSSDARMGRPAEVLCEIAADHEADVLVVGSKGMHRRVLGSVPNTVSHRAPCSVMVVKTT
jgi:nucleotide-binding universal stress UspA family protein